MEFFKNQLIDKLKDDNKIIVLDANDTEYLESTQIPFFKRFIYHCEQLGKSVKIINAVKSLIDYYYRQGINISDDGIMFCYYIN